MQPTATRRVLLVIDMQNDFICGSLGTKEAEAIVGNVAEKIQEYAKHPDNKIVFTRDTHNADDYLESNEGRHLPVEHCIKGTWGWQIADGLVPNLDQALAKIKIIDKGTFGYVGWVRENFENAKIEIVGLCTDICVVSNALIVKAQYPENDIVIDPRCCAGTTPEKHAETLSVLESCQIEII